MNVHALGLRLLIPLAAGCAATNNIDGSGGFGGSGGDTPGPSAILGCQLPAVPQELGDPVKGKDDLLNGNYMSCGVPFKIWQNQLTRAVAETVIRNIVTDGNMETLP